MSGKPRLLSGRQVFSCPQGALSGERTGALSKPTGALSNPTWSPEQAPWVGGRLPLGQLPPHTNHKAAQPHPGSPSS